MAAAPLCSACLSGSIHSGTPTGKEEVIHGLSTYIATPGDGAEPRGLIVMIPDAFGWKMVNNRLLCDTYAKKGRFLVYLPDFMNGAALPAAFLSLDAQINSKPRWSPARLPLYLKAGFLAIPQLIYLRPATCRPRIVSFLQSLRTSPPPSTIQSTSTLKVGIAGFCWGGGFTIQLAQNRAEDRVKRHSSQILGHDKSEEGEAVKLVDCAFTAHPALVKVPVDIENVTLPLSVCIGNTDEWMKETDIATMEQVLIGKNRSEEADGKEDHEFECILLKGANHGFAVRSWEGDEVQMGFADVAERQALKWFERWLS